MVSMDFICDSLGLSKPLNASKDVSRNQRLNVAFELLLIIPL